MNSYLFLQGSPPQTFVFFIINTIKESHLIISCKTSPKKTRFFSCGGQNLPQSGTLGHPPLITFQTSTQGFALSMLQHSMFCMLQAGVSGNSLSRPFPKMKASDSLCPNYGNGFCHSLPLSQILGMFFFHSLPFPELWECFFFIPFPFPNCGNDFFSFPSHSRICCFTDRNQNGNWITVRDTRPPIFLASSTFLKTIILRR